MVTSDLLTFLSSLLSGVIGGSIVAIVNYYLTRRKTEAEIEKLRAETAKARAETKVIEANVENLSATMSYKFTNTAERVIYDSTKSADPHDFRGAESQFWNPQENKPTGPRGAGALTIERGKDGVILNLRRTNTEGRYEIWLQRFLYDGHERDVIPKNELIAGKRKLHVSCEAKVVDSGHSLRFVLRDEQKGQWLANSVTKLTKNEWTPVDFYFQIPPTVNTQFRIDDEAVSKAPSSVQIRKLVVAERVSE